LNGEVNVNERTRALVVDDDEKLAKLLAVALGREHEVTVATSGREALARVEAGERFDLMLCYLMLPGVSGMDLHERVAAVEPELVERILIMTGGAYTPRAVEFLERASIARIEKPFRLAELLRVVREQIERLRKKEVER